MEWTALHKVLEEVEGRGGEGPAGGRNRQMVRCRGYNTTIPGMVVTTTTVPCQTPAYLPTARHHTHPSSLYHHGRSHPGASSMKCHQLAPCLNTGYVLPFWRCQNTCFLPSHNMPYCQECWKQSFLTGKCTVRYVWNSFWAVFLVVAESTPYAAKTCSLNSLLFLLTQFQQNRNTIIYFWN